MKTIFILIASIILVSCSPSGLKNENGIVFDSDKITGKYELNFMDLAHQALEDDTTENLGNAVIYGLASLAKADVSFYKNNKGVYSSNFAEPHKFEYKIESDSIIFLKSDSAEFKRLGIIRKFSDNFDFISITPDSVNCVFNLKKISE